MHKKQKLLRGAVYFASRVYHHAVYQLDRVLAHWVNPSKTIVISGFRRSGTTWLQQSLARILKAKTVFEPLDILNPEVPQMYEAWPIAHKRPELLRLYMPYWPVDGPLNRRPPHDSFPDYLEKALTGNLQGHWARHVRQPSNLLKTRIVLKFTRGQLCIRGIHNQYGCPTIHLTRDPRAVIASIKMSGWDMIFDTLNLQQQLLDQPDGRADFFGQWEALIHDYDQRDKLSKIAAYWALSEKFVQYSFADQPAHTYLVRYEDLVRQPNLLYKILDTIEVGNLQKGELDFVRDDSRSTVKKRRGISPEDRIFGWRKELSAAEIEMVDQVATDFDLTSTLVNK